MNCPPRFLTTAPLRLTLCCLPAICLAALLGTCVPPSAIAQAQVPAPAAGSPAEEKATPSPGPGAGQAEGAAEAVPFIPAIELFPDSIAGLVRIPNLPRFCDAFEKTYLGQLMDEPSMQPFMDSQRERARSFFESANHRVGLQPDDLYDIATGEVVFAWLPFEKDKRRPFSFCIVADTRGARAKADAVLAQIDKDLTAGGATRKDIRYRDQELRLYTPKTKPGQLKVEQIAIALNDQRIIAADRDSVVTDLLDAIAGEPKGESVSKLADFQTVLKRSGQSIRGPVAEGGGVVGAEWFARPFQMGRILREALEVDRGNNVDILNLLENQGFDAVKAAGGVVALAGERFDILHRGFVLAPAVTNEPSKYEKAARMLQFVNTKRGPFPSWVDTTVATATRLHLRIEDAFWASGSLVDEALGDEIFRPSINGIANDKAGPQIDLENDVLPNLDNQIILLTDNVAPFNETSERMLIAVRVSNADKIREAIQKAMEVEPDTEKLDVVPGVDIWRVEQGESDDGFDQEAFGDLGLGFDEDLPSQPPLLDHWAIALVDDEGDDSTPPYLMFSSHPEFLVDTATRVRKGVDGGFGGLPETLSVDEALEKLGCEEPSIERVLRLKLSLRAKYELLRQGKLQDSDSVLASLIRRLLDEESAEEPEPHGANKLPPVAEIQKFLPHGGSYVETVDDGWTVTGFFLK